MGVKLLWTGLTLLTAFDMIFPLPAGQTVGALFMIIGLILMWLDK